MAAASGSDCGGGGSSSEAAEVVAAALLPNHTHRHSSRDNRLVSSGNYTVLACCKIKM